MIAFADYERQNPKIAGDETWRVMKLQKLNDLTQLLCEQISKREKQQIGRSEEIEAECESLKRRVKKLEEEVAYAKEQNGITEAKLQHKEAEIEMLNKKIRSMESANEEKDKKSSEQNKEILKLQGQMQGEMQLMEQRQRDEIQKLQNNLSSLSHEKEMLKEDLKRRKEDLERLQKDHQQTKEEKIRLEEKMKVMEMVDPKEKEATRELRGQLEAVNQELVSLKITNRILNEQYDTQKSHYEDMKTIYEKLIFKQPASAQNDTAQSDIVKFNKQLTESVSKLEAKIKE